MPNKTLLIDARPALTLNEFYACFGRAFMPGRPVATNLDGFADYLRELQAHSLVLSGCRLSVADYTSVANVCSALGVQLKTHA